MYKFHEIPTDQFTPISHENSYLFNHYDKVANFLAYQMDSNFKNNLAKPVQKGYVIEWFSTFGHLVNLSDLKKNIAEKVLIKYWQFQEKIKAQIEQFENTSDENKKNWAQLLSKVFNDKDNFIFSNGDDFTIVWGWKFDNLNNYKPNLQPAKAFDQGAKTQDEEIIPTKKIDPINQEGDAPDEVASIIHDDNDAVILEHTAKKKSFLEFLKWFASTYWGLLWVLTLLIAIVFVVKTITLKVA